VNGIMLERLRRLRRHRLISSLMAALAIALLTSARAASEHSQNPSATDILAGAARNGQTAIEALRGYSYYAELTLQTVSQSDTVTGEYYHFSQITFDSDGSQREKVFESKSTLPKEVFVGTNALNNMTRVYRFTITPDVLAQYEFAYVGRERVDELNTFVFDVKPKVKLPDPAKSHDRYLKGRVWIDDQDLQVVKVAGEALPEQFAHRTPRFETYFQNYDKYWFPAYTTADDDVRAGDRRTRVVVKVRFTGYKKIK
jgi:hypothetical protein